MIRNILASFLFIGLVAFMMGGATGAYFTDEKPLPEPSAFKFGIVEINLVEDNNTEIANGSKLWTITNDGSLPVWVRVKVNDEINEPDEDGNMPQVSFSTDSDNWSYQAYDGYFYFDFPLEAEDVTDFSLNYQAADINAWAGNYEFSLLVEAVQSANNPDKLGW